MHVNIFYGVCNDGKLVNFALMSRERQLPRAPSYLYDINDERMGETAALLSCLDVVVTVDTSVAHLAAALGRPTWILLPYDPDYRWLLGRDDSPWYPTARLFRQSKTRDYATVLDRVRSELETLISAKPRPEIIQ